MLEKSVSLKQNTTSIAIVQYGKTLPRYMMKAGRLFENRMNGRRRMAMVVKDMMAIRI